MNYYYIEKHVLDLNCNQNRHHKEHQQQEWYHPMINLLTVHSDHKKFHHQYHFLIETMNYYYIEKHVLDLSLNHYRHYKEHQQQQWYHPMINLLKIHYNHQQLHHQYHLLIESMKMHHFRGKIYHRIIP